MNSNSILPLPSRHFFLLTSIQTQRAFLVHLFGQVVVQIWKEKSVK